MRHSAVSRYHRFPGRTSAEFNVSQQIMTFRYSLTTSDFAAAQAYATARLKRKVVRSRGLLFLSTVLWAAMTLLLLTTLHAPKASGVGNLASFGSPILWVVVGVFAWVFYYALFVKKAAAVLQDALGPFPIEHEISLSEDGVFVGSSLSSGTYYWRSIEAVETILSGVVITFRTGVCLLVPTTAFGSIEKRSEFVGQIASRVVG